MKNILKMLLGMLAGAAVGYGGVMLIMWLVDGGMPSVKSQSEGVDYGLMAMSIGFTLLWLFVTVFIHLVLHEAGHLVMGLLTGFRFLSFRVFKFTLVKTDEGLRWKRFHIQGTGGQCILELPEDQDVKKAPWFWYNAGGVLMNLLLAGLSLMVLRSCELGMAAFSFFVMMVLVGILVALLNGLPMIVGGVSNDGYNLWTLWRHPEDRRFFVRSLQAVGQLSRGRRMSEMPSDWFEDIPVNEQSHYLEISNRILFMSLLEDQQRYEEARRVAEELMALGKKLAQLYKLEVGGERVMLELLTTQRHDVVDELWDKQLARYTEANSKYSPTKCAVLYAYELLHKHDAEKADTYNQQFETHQHDYTMPGEARTTTMLIESIREKSTENN
jgi:hypothetical protein